MVDSFPREEGQVIGPDFYRYVGKGNRGVEELMMGRSCVKERNLKGQILVDFAEIRNGCGE